MAKGMGATPPSYPEILELDSRIRDFAVPLAWKLDPNPSPVPRETHFHRWFVLASKETGALPLDSCHLSSALITYRSPYESSPAILRPSVVRTPRSSGPARAPL